MQIIPLPLLLLTVHSAFCLHKCCEYNTYLNNLTQVCVKNEDKRLQIFTKNVSFFRANQSGACVDIGGNQINEYKIQNMTIVEETKLEVNFYPKCCPLGFFYNSVSHSCTAQIGLDESFVTQNFIRVGLPQCRVVVDYKLTFGNYRLELGTLHLDGYTKFKDGQFCIDRDERDQIIARGCFEDLSVCHETRCVRKCCPDGQSFVNGQKCKNTYEHGLDLSFSDRVNKSQDPFAIVHNYDCRIYILKKAKYQFYLDTDGSFYAFYNKTNSFKRYEIEEEKSYCIEHVQKKPLNNFEFFMCFNDEPVDVKFLAARWAKIISCIFIIITISVYLFLPEMLNLFGKLLLSYCMAMMTAFILLIYAQFVTDISDSSCVTISFLSSYMSLSSFAWLNVMCFDIWWTFGTPKSFVTQKQKRSELRRLFVYSLYGWGVPAILTVLTFLAYAVFDTPYVVRPYLGAFKCYWERRNGNYGMLIFYVTPLIVMEVANIVFFVRTITYCLRVKGEINRLNENRLSMKERRKVYNIDKEQMFLILKLSITMGISFAFEVVSSFFDFSKYTHTRYIEIVWDAFNCLQGVYIFLIFIFKIKVFRLCRNRICSNTSRKVSMSSLPTTASTQVSVPLNSKKFQNM